MVVDPGPGYRLLADDEVILLGDEFSHTNRNARIKRTRWRRTGFMTDTTVAEARKLFPGLELMYRRKLVGEVKQ